MTRYFHFVWPRHDVIIAPFIDQLMTSIFCLFMTRTLRDFYVIYWQVYDEVFLIFPDHIMTWFSRHLLTNKWRDIFYFDHMGLERGAGRFNIGTIHTCVTVQKCHMHANTYSPHYSLNWYLWDRSTPILQINDQTLFSYSSPRT